MKKITKKLLALCAASLLTLCALAGCAQNGTPQETPGSSSPASQYPAGTPDYEADKGTLKVRFGGWIAPTPAGYYTDVSYNGGKSPSFITEERYQEAADAGFDFMIGIIEQGIGSDDVKAALNAAEAAGMQYFVRWDGVINYASSTKERLTEALGDIMNHPALMGIFSVDEPGAKAFKNLGKIQNLYKQVTDKYFYVNLFPNYANRQQLGDVSYGEYIDSYCATVKNKFISCDHYPFGYDGLTYSLSESMLLNLEQVQTAAAAYGMEHWEFIQGMKADASAKTPDYNDLRMQIYSCLAYGAQTLQYFCYFTLAGYTSGDVGLAALIDEAGNRTPIYDTAKKINAEIHSFEHVFMNFVNGWSGVMPVVGTQNEKGSNSSFGLLQHPLQSIPRIASASATQDTIIGAFKDTDGYDGFMVVNQTIPGHKLTDTVSIRFDSASKAVCYTGGERTVVELINGRLELTLGAGEGVFVIPVV